MTTKKLSIDEESKGKRFDVVATEMLPELSRAYVHVLIEGKRILLNGKQEKAGHKLRKGDVITTDFDLKELDQIPDIDLPVVFEDDDVLVINKPPGVISHSRGRYWNEPSVASFLRQKSNAIGYDPVADAGASAGGRAGIVHRLDRATSGVMICARNQQVLSWLQKQFSERKVKKTYIAVVQGHMDPAEAVIDMPIERNPKAPATFRVGPNGKPAKTHYRTLRKGPSFARVELTPETGRTHQLRVHLAHVGHPIVGDVLYHGPPADRLFLHAHTLEITLPDGQKKTFEAPLPSSFDTVEKT